jgi:hypothetical protein
MRPVAATKASLEASFSCVWLNAVSYSLWETLFPKSLHIVLASFFPRGYR